MDSIHIAIGEDLDKVGLLLRCRRYHEEPDADYRARILEESRKALHPGELKSAMVGTSYFRLGPFQYSRVGFVTVVCIGRLVVYERIGDIRSFAPYLKPKGI